MELLAYTIREGARGPSSTALPAAIRHHIDGSHLNGVRPGFDDMDRRERSLPRHKRSIPEAALHPEKPQTAGATADAAQVDDSQGLWNPPVTSSPKFCSRPIYSHE